MIETPMFLTAGAVLISLAILAAAAPARQGRILPLASVAGTAPAELPPVGDAKVLWRDTAQSVDARARDLLPRLTFEEKISLLHADSQFGTAPLVRFNVARRWMSDGPQGVREEINLTNWNPAGRTDDFATAMPANIGLAASFDLELAKTFGDVIGEEALARGKNIMLGPGLNIMRTPLNGRNCEYFGEDPYLASRMAVAFIDAVQSHGVAACAKHYMANNQETQRNSINVEMDERALHEIYLPAFKAAVTEAHVWSIMTAYNRFRGDYCSESDLLLNQILKKDWGFQGLVMSDWGGVHSTVKAAMNGLDLEMGSPQPFNKNFLADPLVEAVNEGLVPKERIDEMAPASLRVLVATGMFDPPKGQDRCAGLLMSPAHIEAARKIEESACVLLKNENNALPLDVSKIKTIAVIGQNANTKFAHDGNSAAIKTAYEVTPLEGITKRAGADIKVNYVPGYTAGRGGPGRRGRATTAASAPATRNTQIDEAVAAAKNADVAIVVAGLYRGQDQEGADRRDMNLPPGQSELIQAVVAANPRTIVVLNGGGPLTLDPWLPKAAGVLFYWYGGTEGGNALANILFGDVNPSGHLPCSYPKQLSDSPAHSADATVYPGVNGQENYQEGILVGYRWFDTKNIEPLFPFGYGLSYTTFKVSDLAVAPQPIGTAADAPQVTISATVTNTGGREEAEVVQLYIQDMHSSLPRPVKELKGFKKVNLKPGEKATVQIPLKLADFAYYDPDKKGWFAEAGDFTIHVGTSSRDLPLQATYRLAESKLLPP